MMADVARAQTHSESTTYGSVNSFGVFAAYSNDSSHILLGVAEQRKLWNIGASYSRRLYTSHDMSWKYDAEIVPVALEGDPLSRTIVNQTLPTTSNMVYDGGPLISCAPDARTYTYTDPTGVVHSGTVDSFCRGRQWTVGEAMSPVGLQWNFRTRKKIQPVFTAHVGYMYSTQAIPIALAGSFNFTFDFGGGIELFQTKTRSLRVEYRYHHISNHNSAYFNPGIDSGLFQVGYVFGR